MYEIKVQLDDIDYIEYNKYDVLNTPSRVNTFKVYKMLIPSVCVLISIPLVLAKGNLAIVLVMVAICIIISVLWVANSEKSYLKGVEQNIIKAKNYGEVLYNDEETIIKFEDDVVHEISQNIDCKTKYAKFEKIVVTERYLYLFKPGLPTRIIPVTAFESQQEKQEFLKFIHSKIDKY